MEEIFLNSDDKGQNGKELKGYFKEKCILHRNWFIKTYKRECREDVLGGLFNETVISMYNRIREGENIESLDGYFRRSLRNKFIDYQKENNKLNKQFVDIDWKLCDNEPLYKGGIANELSEMVEWLLKEMEKGDCGRLLRSLFEYSDSPGSELAEIHGAGSVNSYYSSRSRCIKKARKIFENKYGKLIWMEIKKELE